MRVLCKIQTFRGESAFSTWLHRLTINVVLMRLRKKAIRAMSFDTNEPNREDKSTKQFGGPDPGLTSSIDRVNLQRAFNQLPRGGVQVRLLPSRRHGVRTPRDRCDAGLLNRSFEIEVAQGAHAFARTDTRKMAEETLATRAGAAVFAACRSLGSDGRPLRMAIFIRPEAAALVRQAIVATTEGKEASAKFQSKFAAQQNDLQNMQKQIQELQNRLSNNQGTPTVEQARL
jgi:hypothetical protein